MSLLVKSFPNLGILIARVCFAVFMLFGHGLAKLVDFQDKADSFPSFFGLPSVVTLGLAVFAEFFCSILVTIGYQTRLACLPLVATMAVAAFMAHAEDPFARKEMALLYLVGFTAIALIGPGKYSVDGRIHAAVHL